MNFLTKLKKAYFYFFYRLYIFFETSTLKWWSDWKAELSISVFEIYLVITLAGILSEILKINLVHLVPIILISLIILISNYFIFLHNEKWKLYIEEFKKLPKSKSLVGGIVIWIIIVLVFASLIFMYYLVSISNQNM